MRDMFTKRLVLQVNQQNMKNHGKQSTRLVQINNLNKSSFFPNGFV